MGDALPDRSGGNVLKNGIGKLFSALWRGVDGIRKILHLIVLLMLFAVIFGALSAPPPSLPSNAALVISPVGALVEQLAGDPYDRALEELLSEQTPQTLVQDVVDGLRFAKDDSRIDAVILDLNGLGGAGMSKLERVADALVDYRSSGKQAVAVADFYSQGSYFLAAHADEIVIHPDGVFLPTGFETYLSYYKDAIDKLKVDWNIFRVGAYKSAVEPYERTDMSAEDRQSRSRLLGQLWARYQSQIEAARSLDAGTITDFSENILGHLSAHDDNLAEAAAALNLVDHLLTRDGVRQHLLNYVAADKDSDRGYRSVALDDYLAQKRLTEGPPARTANVAIVIAAGEILNGSQPPGTIGGESTSEQLRRARLDESVKAVVLRVDSPGGSSFASEQILNEIQALQNAGKPVVASMGSLAASGGYWISMAADQIFARESTITGSIGIFGMFPTFQRSLDYLGVSSDGVGTTRWAGQFRADRALSSDAKELIQRLTDQGYDDFITKVSIHREIEKSTVDEIAQGQVWTGADALDLGLIDAIGGLDEAVAAAAEQAGIGDDGYGTKTFEKELGPTEQMIVNLLSGAASWGFEPPQPRRPSGVGAAVVGTMERLVEPLTRFNDPRGIYAHCLCVVE